MDQDNRVKRIDSKVGSYVGEKDKYAGTQYDSVSALNYMQARYQDPTRGQFLSEDPTFLALGNPPQLAQLSQKDQNQFLMDPAQLVKAENMLRSRSVACIVPARVERGYIAWAGQHSPGPLRLTPSSWRQ